MGMNFRRLRRRSIRFHKDTDGVVSVEAVIWLPFFIFFLFGIVEMSLVFHGQARALQVAQDANRSFSVGEFATADETATWAKASLEGFSDDIKTITWLDRGVITTAIRIPAADLAGNLGIFSMLSNLYITVTSQQVLEF